MLRGVGTGTEKSPLRRARWRGGIFISTLKIRKEEMKLAYPGNESSRAEENNAPFPQRLFLVPERTLSCAGARIAGDCVQFLSHILCTHFRGADGIVRPQRRFW